MSWLFLLGQEYNIPFGPRGWDETLTVNEDDAAMHTTTNDSGCTNLCDGVTECHDYLDEELDSPDNQIILTLQQGKQGVFGFPTPSKNPSTATNAQRFSVIVSACADSNGPPEPFCTELGDAGSGCDPLVYVFLYCNGVKQIPAIYSAVAVGGDLLDEQHDIDWTFDPDCAADGSDTAIGLNTSGCSAGQPEERVTCWEAAKWLVKH
jgi:hypothetical protein